MRHKCSLLATFCDNDLWRHSVEQSHISTSSSHLMHCALMLIDHPVTQPALWRENYVSQQLELEPVLLRACNTTACDMA